MKRDAAIEFLIHPNKAESPNFSEHTSEPALSLQQGYHKDEKVSTCLIFCNFFANIVAEMMVIAPHPLSNGHNDSSNGRLE